MRLGNALLSCAATSANLFLPARPHRLLPAPVGGLPWGRAGLAALALAAVTLVAWRTRRAAPWAAFGWLWFLITLLPVLGILQVGTQARADRYLYLPLVGIFLAVAWGAADLARRRPRSRVPAALAIAAAVVLLAAAAHRQAGYWRDSRTLWEHTLAVDPTSVTALYQLSDYYKEIGRIPEQVALLRRLVRIDPRHQQALNNLAIARYQLGEPPETLLADFRALLAINPKNVKALQNFGFLLIEAGRYAEAIATLERAVAVEPGYCTALNNLGRAYLARGDRPQARRAFERAAACDPEQQKFAQLNLEYSAR